MIELLSQEFQTADIEAKRSAAENLGLIVNSLGPQKVKDKLIPWLLDHLDEDDEILYIFAKKCVLIIDILNGSLCTENILPVIEVLLKVSESSVRNATIDTFEYLFEKHHDIILLKVIELTRKLCNHEKMSSRTSAVSLITVILKIDHTAETFETLKTLFFKLCNDEIPMIRSMAVNQIKIVINRLTTDDIISQVLPFIEKLPTEPYEDVVLSWVANIGSICGALTVEQNDEICLKYIEQLSSSSFWRIRLILARQMSIICRHFSEEIVEKHLIKTCLILFNEPEDMIRDEMSQNFVPLFHALRSDVFVSILLPEIIKLINTDSVFTIKLNLLKGTLDHSVLSAMNPAAVKVHFLPIWKKYLKCNNVLSTIEIRSLILNSFKHIVELLGKLSVANIWLENLVEIHKKSYDFCYTSFSSSVPNSSSDSVQYPIWRIRRDILNALFCLVGSKCQNTNNTILSIWKSNLCDFIYAIREHAVEFFIDILKLDQSAEIQNIQTSCCKSLIEFFEKSKTELCHRVTFVHAFGRVMETEPKLGVKFFPYFRECICDKLINVRIASVMVALKIKDDEFWSEFIDIVDIFSNDTNPDVQSLAQGFLNKPTP